MASIDVPVSDCDGGGYTATAPNLEASLEQRTEVHTRVKAQLARRKLWPLRR
ncbi:hypothetical protein V6Z12_D06G073900 [Gossypium hirsutum]